MYRTQTPLQARFVADAADLTGSPTDVLTTKDEKPLKFRERTLSPVMFEEDGQSLKLETTLITNPAGSEILLSFKPGK
jgi:hypothetical protein